MPSGFNARPPFSLEVDEVSETLRRHVEGSNTFFDATADNIVRVRVNSSMSVVEVEVLAPNIDARTREELQIATRGAVNAALQKAALAAGQAFAELAQKVRLRGRDGEATEPSGKNGPSEPVD